MNHGNKTTGLNTVTVHITYGFSFMGVDNITTNIHITKTSLDLAELIIYKDDTTVIVE